MDLDDGKTNSRNERAPSVGDQVEVYKFPEKKWTSIRLVPGLVSTASFWVKVKRKSGALTKFNTPARSYDPVAQELDSTIKDPWRDLYKAEKARSSGDKTSAKSKDDSLIQFSQEWYMEGIVRSIQKQLPERLPKPTRQEAKTGFKEKDSDSMTAFRAIRLGSSLLGKIKELKGLNTVESKSGGVRAFSVNDAKYGRDIRVYFDSTKAPADMYQVQLGEKRTPLTEEELGMLRQNIEAACAPVKTDEKAVLADFKSWATRMGVTLDSDEDDEDEDEKLSKSKKSSSKASKRSKDVDEDEDFDDEDAGEDDEDERPSKSKKSSSKRSSKDEDEDDDFDDEDEDEDEKPSRSKAKKSSAKRSSKDEEDEDDFEDEDDEDEDERPSRSKSKKVPAKKTSTKRSSKDEDDFDDDEDEGEDDDFEDEEDEDEKPSRSKAKKSPSKASKRSSKDEDDDFDDDEDEDDEDEDERPSRSRKPAAKKTSTKRSSKDEDDFDDDEDEDDDFDDDEDEKPSKSKKSAPAKSKKSSSKRSSKDEDDDEDDIPF